MDTFTVSFFGHRQLPDPISLAGEMEAQICQLLLTKPYTEFLVGRTGEFDLLAAAVVRRCQRLYRRDNSALVLVLPYAPADVSGLEGDYDEIEVFPPVHYKAAYQLRNQAMVTRSDLCLFYVDHPQGGAYQTLQWAAAAGACVQNLGRLPVPGK